MASQAKGKNSTRSVFKEFPASIKVVGVGGGGVNVITRMMKRSVPGVSYICVNTDIKSLRRVEGAEVIQIGERITRGMGAGGNPDVGAKAADTGRMALQRAIGKPDMVFLTAGMGGGTGTGAAPIVAELAKESGAVVVAVVTTPFSFEGSRRLDTALNGMGKLREKVDNLIVIHNDRLLRLVKHDVPMEEALLMADEAVMLGVLSIAELINVAGEINVDFADVRTILNLPGHSLMAIGQGQGPTGSLDAASQAVNNPLLDLSINGAKGILFNVNGGPQLTLGQVNAAGEFIAKRVDPDAIIFFGMINDQTLADRVRITVIATGIPVNAPHRASGSDVLWQRPSVEAER